MMQINRDWATPRTASMFTGYAGIFISGFILSFLFSVSFFISLLFYRLNNLNATGHARDGSGGPAGTLILAVANTPIPCKPGIIEGQKSFQFTIVNIRKTGWMYAPWHKPAKNSKAVKDENTKPLFENGEWEKNDVTMERVVKVLLTPNNP